MKKFISILFLSFFAMANQTFASDTEEQPIVMGTASGYAPFVSLNDKGEYEGFDIDIAREVAKKLGRSLSLKDCGSMPSLMLALKQQKVDAIIWAISITEERENNIELVYYQGDIEDTVPLIFWKQIPEEIVALSDLGKNAKKPICVEAGSYQEDIFKTCPSISLKYFDAVNDVILDLKYGKSLASAIDPSLIPRFTEKYPDLKVLSLPLPKEMQSKGNGIGINKSDQELAAQVRKAVKELETEGTIFQLEKKWGLR